MFKEIIRLFSKDKLPATKTDDLKPTTLALEVDNRVQRAEELSKLGDQSLKANEIEQAEIYYRKSLEADPASASVYKNLGIALYYLKHFDEALANYDCAISLQPDFAEAHSNRGLLLNDLKRFDEALTSLDNAIRLKPELVFSHNNRGIVLKNLYRFDEALFNYDHAISIKPDYAEAYNNRGVVLKELNKLNESLIDYDRAIELKPTYAEAYYNRGVVLEGLNRLDEALASYSRAIVHKPDHEIFYGHWLHTKMSLCDWSNYEDQLKFLTDKIKLDKNVCVPFALLSLSNSRELQKKSAEIFSQAKFPHNNTTPKTIKYAKHDKIRLGYFSADFRNHPVSFLTVELFEAHDRSKFELIAFSLGSTNDEMKKRVSLSFDHFIEVNTLSDQEVALLARNLEIDIAIDLGGYTADNRPGIFALRAAPIQVSYIGYLGTMGARYIDYLIADSTIIPQQHQKNYTEKIIYLPSYQVNDTKRIISDKLFTREELGLPAKGFVFCCFNNPYKITPIIFDSWMRILNQVVGSVLWLFDSNLTTVYNLKKEATLRGINPNRLIFAKRLPVPEYLARYRIADLFLDTTPYNAGTTASDSLWAGLPVLTYLGETFAGRMAASLLNAVHLPELITISLEDYEALAVDLASTPDKLMSIKQKLAENRLTTSLFNTERFAQYIESAYIEIHQRYQANLLPDYITVALKP